MKSNLIIALAAMLALAAGIWLRFENNSAAPRLEQAGEQLQFGFPDVAGQLQNVEQWRGKILVINFWATWCPPCLKEIPEFIQLQQEYQASNVQFVGIAVDDKDAVADYLQSIQINYPILIAGDAGSLLSQQMGNIISALPFTVLVNPQGQIIHRQPGELSKEQFLRLVKPLLAAKG